MSSMEITVIARMRARHGRAAELRAALLELVAETRREDPGCFAYDLHVSASDPDAFVMLERWVDQQALNDHLASAHVHAFADRSTEYFAEPLGLESYLDVNRRPATAPGEERRAGGA